MNERPELNIELDAATFRSFYYLKRELANFCRENGLPASGGYSVLGTAQPISCVLRPAYLLLCCTVTTKWQRSIIATGRKNYAEAGEYIDYEEDEYGEYEHIEC
mgnify:CR=1 FL=1